MTSKVLMLITVIIISFICMYLYTFILDYINKNDKEKIENKISIKIFLSAMSSILIVLLYIKIGMCFDFYTYFILINFLIIIGYIDYRTKYVYDILSKPLVIYSIIVCVGNLVLGNITLTEVLGSIITIGVIIFFAKLNYIGAGDVQILSSVFLIVNKVYLLPGIVLIFSLGISGIASIYLLVIKKVDLNYRKPLCPSILLATYALLIII